MNADVLKRSVRHARSLSARIVCEVTTLGLALSGGLVQAATLPSGYTETLVASGLSEVTAMNVAPDGRVFVCEQAGRLRVVKNGALLSTPFVTLTVDGYYERGLLGVAFHPNFATNPYVYVYYTAVTPTRHNRVSRFTANGDVAVPGSELPLIDLEELGAPAHNGGAIAFGPDGKLYIAVGENVNGANAQSFSTVKGKMLRISADGSIPSDNPFFGTTTGINRSIWALGLRNPFTFAFDPPTGLMFINDVGENTWEEINEGGAGANYGWPGTEGTTNDPQYNSPRYAYNHATGSPKGCSIAGGAFYSPLTSRFPAGEYGNYFFTDYCVGWISKLDPVTNTVTGFASGISNPVDLKVSTDGFLYYLARGTGVGTGTLWKIGYASGTSPSITTHPTDKTAPIGGSATFTFAVSGAAPLSNQWQRNGADIVGATVSNYTVAPIQSSDDGARFRVVVSNPQGIATSNEAALHVSANALPTATIPQPAEGTLYTAGENVFVQGSGTDPEDGTLAASAFSWVILLHHDAHMHPFMSGVGVKSGSVPIPNTGETSANVYYGIELTVTDSTGQPHTATRNLNPRKSNVTLRTNFPGLQLLLDSQPVMPPHTFTGVVGFMRSIGVTTPQTVSGVTYDFVSWSDGGAATHNVTTPSADVTYTATFAARGGGGCTAPGAPTGLTVSKAGSTLTLTWIAPASGGALTTYVIEAGSSAGATNFGTYATGNTATSFGAAVGPGTYFLRIRARNACGTSGASNEQSITLP